MTREPDHLPPTSSVFGWNSEIGYFNDAGGRIPHSNLYVMNCNELVLSKNCHSNIYKIAISELNATHCARHLGPFLRIPEGQISLSTSQRRKTRPCEVIYAAQYHGDNQVVRKGFQTPKPKVLPPAMVSSLIFNYSPSTSAKSKPKRNKTQQHHNLGKKINKKPDNKQS